MNALNTLLHYIFFCHRLPERSFFYKGKQFPICARCTGILIGYFIGIIYIILFNQHIIFELFLMIPLSIDGIGQFYGKWTSTNIKRLITGILAGISTVCILRLAVTLGYNHGKYFFKIFFN